MSIFLFNFIQTINPSSDIFHTLKLVIFMINFSEVRIKILQNTTQFLNINVFQLCKVFLGQIVMEYFDVAICGLLGIFGGSPIQTFQYFLVTFTKVPPPSPRSGWEGTPFC